MSSFRSPIPLGCSCLALACLVACGGGGSSSSTTTGGGGGGGTTTVTGATTVYVIQNPLTFGSSAGAILQFPATSSGSVSPAATLNAPASSSFNAVTTDAAGNLYAAYSGTGSISGINVYSAGSTASATPTRNIPGNSTTGVTAVDGLATSAAGEIFAAEDYGGIQAFSATATGSAAPARRILGAYETGGGLSTVGTAYAIAADSADNLYVINQAVPTAQPIVVFAPSATGNIAPAYGIGGALTGLTMGNVFGITFDSAGNLYVTTALINLNNSAVTITGSILEFAAGARGNVAPIRTITGAATQLHAVAGIKVDSAGNIFVVSANPASATATNPNVSVLEFAPAASGNVAPASSFTSTAWTNPDNAGSIALH